METALRRIADTLLTFVDDTVARYGGEVWWPSNWPGITWVLLAVLLVLLWVASRRQRRPRGLEVRPPQLLVTNGEVVPHAAGGGAPGERPSVGRRRLDAVVHATSGTLAMTVSNLSRYPVQVLEVALRDEPRGAPRVVAVDAVVPAMGSVTVEGPVPLALRGDGWLDLYCYAAATRAKMHRHRVELVWEPWSARFKVAPLEQALVAVRRLASDEPRARFLDDAVVGAAPEPEEPTAAPTEVALNGDRRAWVAAPVSAAADAAAPRVVPTPRPRPVARPAAEAPGAGSEEAHVARDDGDPIDGVVVPRIATPPVGVAVTGRGGSAARAPGGHPIGRPRAAPAVEPRSGREPAVADGSATAAGPAGPTRPAAAPATVDGGAGASVVRDGAEAPGAVPASSAAASPTPAPAIEPAPALAAATDVVPAPEAAPSMVQADAEVPAPEAAPSWDEADADVPAPEGAAATHEPFNPRRDRAEPAPNAAPRRPRLEFPDEF